MNLGLIILVGPTELWVKKRKLSWILEIGIYAETTQLSFMQSILLLMICAFCILQGSCELPIVQWYVLWTHIFIIYILITTIIMYVLILMSLILMYKVSPDSWYTFSFWFTVYATYLLYFSLYILELQIVVGGFNIHICLTTDIALNKAPWARKVP